MQVRNELQPNHIEEVSRRMVVCAVTAFCYYCSHADDLSILQVCLCSNLLIGMLCNTETHYGVTHCTTTAHSVSALLVQRTAADTPFGHGPFLHPLLAHCSMLLSSPLQDGECSL